MIVGCSGLVRPNTGIGVIQRALYPRLQARGHSVRIGGDREVDGGRASRVAGFANGLTLPRGVDCYLSLVPPLPLGVGHVPTVAFVHDLRWIRTRGWLARRYRAWDLSRTLRHADYVLTISDTTRRDVVRFDPGHRAHVSTCLLGPGIIVDRYCGGEERVDGRVLLVGGAAHKRNELAAAALVRSKPSWCRDVAGVGVSRRTREILSDGLGPTRCHWFDDVDDETMRRIYRSASTFVLLSTDEGFGLPYVEALSSGCQVVAADTPLTREIVADAAIFVDADGDAGALGRQFSAVGDIPSEVRRGRAEMFSWDAFTDVVVDSLKNALCEV